MNSSIFKILWIWISIPWLSSFTRAERVALFAALLVLFGVIGEEVVELKFLEAPERARLKRNIKRWSISLLLWDFPVMLSESIWAKQKWPQLRKQQAMPRPLPKQPMTKRMQWGKRLLP